MDSVFLSNEDSSSLNNRSGGLSSIPTWRLPLSKTYSSGLKSLLYQDEDTEKDKETIPGDNNNFFRARSMSSDNNFEDAQTVIQILLPCIICNRTFSPEALERHSKICTRVRANDKRPTRPTFDSAIQRIKDTKMADFIPPPPEYSQQESCFTRNGRGRSSFQGSPTRSSFGKGSNSAAPWRRQRASSTPKTFISQNGGGSDNYGILDDQPGSPDDDDRSMISGNHTSLPSYARALSPTDDCPYCLRSFGLKAYDRHVSYCKEVWERKQYEIQPTPVELEEARERQEIRTKYKPMKGSNSCSSLRSVSPPRSKDQGIGSRNFASAALNKLFGGLKRTENRTLFRTPDRMKKSNESLTSSCYGDFARSNSMRRHEPSPSRHDPRLYMSQKSHPMQLNTSSNVQKKTKSTDSLASLNSVPSSGYGPGGSYLNNFSRNSKTRSSLNHNFFRTKRVEPEGLENTGSSNTTNPLIITPMNFYSKQRSDSTSTNDYKQNEPHDSQNKSSGTLFSSDSNSNKYDPYEKAAKQLEELLRTQPLLHKNSKSNSRTQRRIGIDRAFASVNPLGLMPDDNMTTRTNDESDNNRRENGFANSKTTGNKSNLLDPPQYNSPNRFTAASEDSYWEEILDKKSRSRDEQESRDRQRDHQDSMQLSDSSEPINNCGDGQEASQQEKSRAVSNISSADSAFSRSDGTDLEFEALESLVTKSLGNVPLTSSSSGLPESQSQSQSHSSPSKSTDLISSRNPPMMMTSFVSKPPSLENTTGLNPTLAKFCHECGTCYPTSAAKFCPECGERRVVNV